ncbi:FRG domain-containing protein [Teredinibacter waterburyi]|uniref:FRG domain-containing protein n=1 Tax=Teredinibacter waterburyi TaxID=1500538 RepID=UPI00165F59CC|nr:FRG domain-containing protein [Teredinibacter waterburyi]
MFKWISEKTFSTAREFSEFALKNLVTRDYNYGFRGHADDLWKLEPTITRYYDSIKEHFPNFKVEEDYKRIEHLLLESFRSSVIKNNDIKRSDIDDVDLWQVGQHYGLPTPLLDWTHSPWVAFYFALIDGGLKNGESSNRCVWRINIDLLHMINQTIESELWPKYKENLKPESLLKERIPLLELVDEDNGVNRRIVLQQGFFSKLTYFRSIEVWIKVTSEKMAHPNLGIPLIEKYIFPVTELSRLSMLDNLDKMNINGRTLFPGIDGSAKTVMEKTLRSLQNPKYRSFCFTAAK